MKANPGTYAVVFVTFIVAALPVFAQEEVSQKLLLQQLDEAIGNAGRYVSDKEVRIMSIENTLHSRGVSEEKQYEIYGLLFDEYRTYNFNKAVEALSNQKTLALTLKDRSKINDILLKEAMLNTAAGEYLEASNILESIDTTVFTREQEIEYCNVRQRFWNDYQENMNADNEDGFRMRDWYRNRVMDLAPPGSELSQYISVLQSITEGNYAQADFINRHALSKMNPVSHEYANQAYYQARICESLERREDMENWFIRSAIADIKTATKDNASLISLANELFKDGDLEHAFNYTQFSLGDAISFDAKLRQWQIAAILPAIQKGYSDNQAIHQKRTRVFLVVLSFLAFLLLISSFGFYRMYRRQKEANRKVEEMNNKIKENSEALADFNSRLKIMNRDLTEANAAKEEYIGLFLSMCSDYIDKMKAHLTKTRKMALAGQYDKILAEASSLQLVDDELRSFYEMFDKAFLKLYPKFVEQFNDLLKEDSRIELKKGKLLNTELRIFALIRLGITQSSDIASMLRYSTNTIYNYRAQIKNASLGDRETFEDRVKLIGN